MKHYVRLVGLAISLISVNSAYAGSPQILVEGESACPAQLTEFKAALAQDPKIVKAMPVTAQGYAYVSITAPQKTVDPRLSSSGYGLSSWELSPSLDENGNCVPVKAADILASVQNWNAPSMMIAAGSENCRMEVGQILDAQSERPDLFAGMMSSIVRGTTDEALNKLVPPDPSIPNRRVFPYQGMIEVIPNAKSDGSCIPIKTKEIIQALSQMKNALETKAEFSLPGIQHQKSGAPVETLDSKIGGVELFVGSAQ
jgi:hypothetical protein